MHRTLKQKSLALALGVLSLSSMALGVTRVPGTFTYYSAIKDPITDVNKSFVIIDEVNDRVGDTAFVIRCSNRDMPTLWASLNSKNNLLTEGDAYVGTLPVLTMRLGTDAPIVLKDQELVSVTDSNDDFKGTSIGIQSTAVRTIVNGLLGGKKLVVRVNRPSGGQALTYTFPAQGFSQAWNAVRGCAPFASSTGGAVTGNLGSSAAGSAATSTQAPKFTKWYFTTCKDASSGAVRTGLLAGRAHLCDLVIETVPNGARPVSASFRYELEYREGNRTGKLQLDAEDRWPSSGGPVTRFRQNGSDLIFTLPLNVRVRPNRVYTSINVTANVNFDNGSSKRVYEPLPVR
ncbi:hypothetical protein SAMN04488058_101268 [Deinococcus reticulitermitis]|uniref:Uncharacterized protein n=1 Tax=Deinococcus reticulitermitis TaxID=856736 RepID=A0A1H6SPS7_9DEIO|nr:hypothetical protein [Deinococcus reticulitermitis]SEI66040.1 hypothetical protein SAMN04488058_101268 [Deinococcus reticulitermitis]